MNPQIYYESKMNEDPQEFVVEVHKFLYDMGLNEEEMAEFDAY